jgi:hypothetical protein
MSARTAPPRATRTGNASDPLAQLYEVTGASAFPLRVPAANLRMDAESVSFGDDFVLSRDLSTGHSSIGSFFGMQTGVDAQHRFTGSSDGNFSVLRVEAWLVDVNEFEALTAEEEAWLGKALGYVDLSHKKMCFDADMTGASDAGYQKSMLAFNLYCPMNLAREDIARVEDQYKLNLTDTYSFDWDNDMVVGVAVTTTGKKIAFKQSMGNFEIKGGNSLTALYEVTAGVTFLPADAVLGATAPPNSLAATDDLSLPNMEMQIAHDISSGTMFKHGWGYYAAVKEPSGASDSAAAAAAVAPDVPCTKTDALCYGNRDPGLVNSLCEGVQCATMTHVLKLERHWRDVGRSDTAGRHFGCTVGDAALCYGNRLGWNGVPSSDQLHAASSLQLPCSRFLEDPCFQLWQISENVANVCGYTSTHVQTVRFSYCGNQCVALVTGTATCAACTAAASSARPPTRQGRTRRLFVIDVPRNVRLISLVSSSSIPSTVVAQHEPMYPFLNHWQSSHFTSWRCSSYVENGTFVRQGRRMWSV